MAREPTLRLRSPSLRLRARDLHLAQASLRRGEVLPRPGEHEDRLLLADRERADLSPSTGKLSFDRSYAHWVPVDLSSQRRTLRWRVGPGRASDDDAAIADDVLLVVIGTGSIIPRRVWWTDTNSSE